MKKILLLLTMLSVSITVCMKKEKKYVLAVGGRFIKKNFGLTSKIRLLDLKTENVIKEFNVSEKPMALAFNKSGDQLLAGLRSYNVQTFDVDKKVPISIFSFGNNQEKPTTMSFSENGNFLGFLYRCHCHYSNKELKIMDLTTKKFIANLYFDIDRVGVVMYLTISKDGRYFALNAVSSYGEENKIKIYDIKQEKWVLTIDLPNSIHGLAFSSQGNIIVLGYNRIEMFDKKTGKSLKKYEVDTNSEIFAFSPDDSILAVGGPDTIKIWNLKAEKIIKTWKWKGMPKSCYGGGGITSLAFKPFDSKEKMAKKDLDYRKQLLLYEPPQLPWQTVDEDPEIEYVIVELPNGKKVKMPKLFLRWLEPLN